MRPFCRNREPIRTALAALIVRALGPMLADFATESPYPTVVLPSFC
jgi:hypothetical protein